MKLALLAALFGSVAAVASANELRGPSDAVDPVVEYVYAPPPVETDLKTLWDELANEATFMQEMITLGRSTGQCKRECNERGENNPNFNRARCRRNCDQIKDKGNNNNRNRDSCDDCRESFTRGSRSYDRCMEACRGARYDRCSDPRRCNDCNSCKTSRSERSCLRRCDSDDASGFLEGAFQQQLADARDYEEGSEDSED